MSTAPHGPSYIGDPFAAVIAELRMMRAAIESLRPGIQARPVTPPALPSVPTLCGMTYAEAAKRLRVSEGTIRNWAKCGRIKVTPRGRRRFISDSEIRRVEQDGLE